MGVRPPLVAGWRAGGAGPPRGRPRHSNSGSHGRSCHRRRCRGIARTGSPAGCPWWPPRSAGRRSSARRAASTQRAAAARRPARSGWVQRERAMPRSAAMAPRSAIRRGLFGQVRDPPGDAGLGQVARRFGIELGERDDDLVGDAGERIGEAGEVGAVPAGLGLGRQQDRVVAPHHHAPAVGRRDRARILDREPGVDHVGVDRPRITEDGVLHDERLALRRDRGEGACERPRVAGPEHVAVDRVGAKVDPVGPLAIGIRDRDLAGRQRRQEPVAVKGRDIAAIAGRDDHGAIIARGRARDIRELRVIGAERCRRSCVPQCCVPQCCVPQCCGPPAAAAWSTSP